MSRPFFSSSSHLANAPHSERLEDYYKSGRMLVKMAEALGRISLAGRELTRLAGFTERVTQLITVLDDLNKGVYQRTMITGKDANNNITNEKASSTANTAVALKPNSGKFIYQDNIIKY